MNDESKKRDRQLNLEKHQTNLLSFQSIQSINTCDCESTIRPPIESSTFTMEETITIGMPEGFR